MAYSAGNLDVQISAISDGAINSLDSVIAKLSSLSTVLRSVTKDDMKWINSFGTRIKNLSKKMSDIDWETTEKGFNTLTISITPFIEKVAKAETSLRSLSEILTKVSGQKLSLGGSSTSGRSSILGGINFGKLFSIAAMVRFGRAVENIVEYGKDFTETLNVWQVAMRENLDQADEFIKKMNKAYSISQQTLMNAQAIFKNMIGSLGNISDAVAYSLSESVVQMAADFSSLYNTTFEQAITKFQAALAGQVRPIRSVSGYDITESTLYQVYQSLGGTKTVRQLNRTEKQLLSIYAVFQQMQRSGAVGDLSKTLDNFANQARMVTENFKELKTYVGLFLQDLLQSWGVLKYINAGLIFATEIVKALTKYEAPNFLEGMFESTVAENEAIDELQGKLLDFDKFRALDSGVGSDLAIDQSILDAVGQYQSVLNGVNNEARELATKWLKDIGLLIEDENGDLVMSDKKLKDIESTIKGIGIALGVIAAIRIGGTIAGVVEQLNKLNKSGSLLNTILIGGIVYAVVKAYEAFKNGDYWGGILATMIGVTLVFAFGLLNKKMIQTTSIKIIEFIQDLAKKAEVAASKLPLLTKQVTALDVAISAVGLAILGIGLSKFISEWDNMSGAQRAVGIFVALAGAITAAAIAMNVFGMNWAGALGVAATVAGGALAVVSALPKYANGGLPDKGTVFLAGEAGAEVVYNTPSGQSGVANISQLKSAFYQALVEYGQNNKDNQPIVVTLDGEVVYRSTTAHANRRGQKWA